MAFCTKCGAPNPEHASSCCVCGAPMASRQQFCTRCGAMIPAGAAVCPNCRAETARTSPSRSGGSGGSSFRLAGDLARNMNSSPAPDPSSRYFSPAPAYTDASSRYPTEPAPSYAPPVPIYAEPPAPAYPAPAYNAAPPAVVVLPPRAAGYAPTGAYGGMPPVIPHRSDRNWVVMILLSLITCGIYSIIFMTQITNEVNIVCSPHDNRRSTHYCLMFFLLFGLTLGIGWFVWYHNLCDRIGNELRRRGINYEFGAGTFWGWNILGSLILVGPFIFLHKFTTAVNCMNADYNQRG